MSPTVQQLTSVHRTHKAKSQKWDLLTRIVESEVTVEDKQTLLKHPDNRPESLKEKRAEVAHFSSLLGGLVIKLQSYIMSKKGVYEPFIAGGTTMSGDPLWGQFIENCTQEGDSFHKVLSTGLLQSLTTGLAFFQVDTLPSPHARNKAEQREMGGDRPFVVLRNRSDIVDWHKQGSYGMIKLHSIEYLRNSWLSPATPTHLYQVYQRYQDGRITSQKWRILPPKGSAPTESFTPGTDARVELDSPEQDIFHINTPSGKVFRLPLISMKIDPNLILGIQLLEIYSQYFTQMAAINYASLISLWRQLIFTNVTDESLIAKAIGEGAGDGFWWALPPGVEAKWLETDTAGLEFALRYAEVLKGEMYEQVAQIAASAAATYVGMKRSAESKEADQQNMNILLRVYGSVVRQTAKQVLDCAAIARGELIDSNVVGFDKYDGDRFLEDLEEFLSASPVIKSPTFDREGRKILAAGAVDALGLPPALLKQISDEIDATSQSGGVE